MLTRFRPFTKLLVCILIAIILWNLAGLFDVSVKAWHIFSIFITVIIAFILRPFPMGMLVLIGLMTLVATQTVSIQESLTGFSDSTVWLVVGAFIIAGAVIDTGFGERVAYWLVSKIGKSIMGLGYAICGSELILGPFIPSNTARGGGVHAPIVNSLSHSLKSTAFENPERAGQYLSLLGSHANLITAAMFLTGMAANPLLSRAVEDSYGIEFGWTIWALGSVVPGLVALALLPWLIFKLSKPTISDVKAARMEAIHKLKEMGPVNWKEKVMVLVMVLMLLLWSTSFIHGMSTTTVVFLGIITLLLTGAQTWKDVIKNDMAWDTLVWLGGLLTMANLLLDYGFIQWFVSQLQVLVTGISGVGVIIILAVIYFYSMYGFSMLTAHITAMAFPFLALCATTAEQGLVAAALFGYFSCLCGCTTNYSTGPVIIYFGLGYVQAPKWFQVGFFVSIFHMIIWLGVGMVWWKVLGWW